MKIAIQALNYETTDVILLNLNCEAIFPLDFCISYEIKDVKPLKGSTNFFLLGFNHVVMPKENIA